MVHAPRSASPVPNSKTTAPCTPPCTPYRERATTFLNTEAPLVSTNCLHSPSLHLHLPACPTLTSRHLCGRRGVAYILPTTASTLELRANPGPTQNWVSLFRQRLPPGHPGVSELGDIILGGEGRRIRERQQKREKRQERGEPRGHRDRDRSEGRGRQGEREEGAHPRWMAAPSPTPPIRTCLPLVCGIHLFIRQIFTEHLLCTRHRPRTGDPAMNGADKAPGLRELTF